MWCKQCLENCLNGWPDFLLHFGHHHEKGIPSLSCWSWERMMNKWNRAFPAKLLQPNIHKSSCCCWVASVVSDSVRPHRRQPARLCPPWESPGKNTGGGCHFLLQCMKVKSESEVVQSCPTLSDPMDCSLPGSSIHGIFQARVLECGAIAFSS